MVEYAINLNSVFASLADATRRDILGRVLKRPRSIGELAKAHRRISFAAVAKHIGVLEQALLVTKQRQGRQQIIRANPVAIRAATDTLHAFQAMWDARFSALDQLLEEESS